jgi:hypothetical protein
MNLTLINSLSALSGLIVSGTGLLIIVIGGFYVIKSGVGKTVSKANQEAIVALQATILALQADCQRCEKKVDDLTKDKIRLELTIDTMCDALKSRGLLITIQGEMINIDTLDGKSSTVTRIHSKQIGQ